MADKGKPGRRPSTPTDYQDVLKLRLRRARGTRSYAEIAKLLTQQMGREILADTYRQWESKWTLPLDAILPVCDITKVHFYQFLGPITDEERQEIKKSNPQKELAIKVRFLKPKRSDS